MFLFLASTAVTLAPPARSEAQATASIRIERPAIANSKAWDRTPAASRRQIIVRDEHGQPVLVRIIEFP